MYPPCRGPQVGARRKQACPPRWDEIVKPGGFRVQSTPNPPGGTFDRDANGELNGRVTDRAHNAFNRVGKRTTFTEDQKLQRDRDGLAYISKQFVRYGVTSVHQCRTTSTPGSSMCIGRVSKLIAMQMGTSLSIWACSGRASAEAVPASGRAAQDHALHVDQR